MGEDYTPEPTKQNDEPKDTTEDSPKKAAEPTVKEGDRVRILIDTPENTPVEGTVRVVQDETGKKIGVELDRSTATAHTLDGLLGDEKVDPNSNVKYGKGWWTLEENLEVL